MNIKHPISSDSNSTNSSRRYAYQSTKLSASSTRNKAVINCGSTSKGSAASLYSFQFNPKANGHKPEIMTIMPKPKQSGWAFVTKLTLHQDKKRFNSVDSSRAPTGPITRFPSSKFNSTISNLSIEKGNGGKWTSQKLNKTYFSARVKGNGNKNTKISSRLNNCGTSMRQKIFRTSMSLASYKNSSSLNTSINNSLINDNKRDFYIKYQKVPYMNSLALSHALMIKSITTDDNNAECEQSKALNERVREKEVTMKETIDNSRQFDSSLIRKNKTIKSYDDNKNECFKTLECSDKMGIASCQSSIDCDRKNSQDDQLRKKLVMIKKQKTIESTQSKQGSRRNLVLKYFNYDHFINKKKTVKSIDNTIDSDKEKVKIEKKREEGERGQKLVKKVQHSQSLPSKNYQKLIDTEDLHLGRKSVSPNKELFSFLFKEKDRANTIRQASNDTKETVKAAAITKEANRDQKSHKSSQLIYTHINQFTVEGKKETRSTQTIPSANTITLTLPEYEISQNDNKLYHHTAITSKPNECCELPNNIEETKHIDLIDNHNDNCTFNNEESKLDPLENVLSIDNSTIHCNNINPTNKICTFLPNENTISNTSLCNDNISIQIKEEADAEAEAEIDISLLGPIQTDESIEDSTKIKLHIESKQIPNPLGQSNSNDCSFSSKGFKSNANLSNSVESILIELYSNINEQRKLINYFYMESQSTESIKLLFHISNQNITYLKKLISVEAIIPKGNLKHLTKLKNNSTLQDILLCELIDIRTHKEITDNIKLIVELINKNERIIQSIMKQYKFH